MACLICSGNCGNRHVKGTHLGGEFGPTCGVVTGRPKVQTCHPSLLEQFAMDPNRTVALEDPKSMSHTVLRRDAQAHVDMVRHVTKQTGQSPSLRL